MSEYDSDKLREVDCDDECCGVRWEAADIIDARDERITELKAELQHVTIRFAEYVEEKSLEAANKHIAVLKAAVDAQAEDEGLWFIARTAPEGYLQAELRKLHRLIEGEQK
jgi:hypothetical protein